MNDFAKILETWENRGDRRDREAFDKDTPRNETPSLPSRTEMEKARIDDELDLHGLVVEEALTSLRFFLRDSRIGGLRKVLIIHGKGLHSENKKGVLRESVQQMLLKDRHVAAWGEAGRKDGGRGATWVWLNVRGK